MAKANCSWPSKFSWPKTSLANCSWPGINPGPAGVFQGLFQEKKPVGPFGQLSFESQFPLVWTGAARRSCAAPLESRGDGGPQAPEKIWVAPKVQTLNRVRYTAFFPLSIIRRFLINTVILYVYAYWVCCGRIPTHKCAIRNQLMLCWQY